MRIAVIQMVSGIDVESNLKRADALMSDAARSVVDAIFLPENFAALGHPAPVDIGESESYGAKPITSFLCEAARKNQCWIFGGTFPMRTRANGSNATDNRVRAASIVIDELGEVRARYDKVHMFDVDVDDAHKRYRESETFEHGDQVLVVDSPCGRVGLSVCYDIRFSELYLQLFKLGAQLFAIPSAFTVPTGKAHFHTLMRARAIESFGFTVAACQSGRHDSGRETYGHSMVVNPWGEILAEANSGEQVLIVDIDLEQVSEARAQMPVLQQRRLRLSD